MSRILSLLSAILLLVCSAMGVTLLVDDVTTEPSGAFQLPLSIDVTADEEVAAIQFDLLFDTAVFEAGTIQTGAASDNAEKSISVTSQPDGSVRVALTRMCTPTE